MSNSLLGSMLSKQGKMLGSKKWRNNLFEGYAKYEFDEEFVFNSLRTIFIDVIINIYFDTRSGKSLRSTVG